MLAFGSFRDLERRPAKLKRALHSGLCMARMLLVRNELQSAIIAHNRVRIGSFTWYRSMFETGEACRSEVIQELKGKLPCNCLTAIQQQGAWIAQMASPTHFIMMIF